MGAQVGIIGAGIHGVSAAYHLARTGVDTVVFEKDTPAAGPTGASGGIVRAYYTNPFLADVAREAVEFFGAFAEHTGGGTADYHRTGGLYLHAEQDRDQVGLASALLSSVGTANHVVEPEEIAAIVPGIVTDDVGLGLWEDHAGHADPYATTRSLAAAARAAGARVLSHTAVVGIAETSSGVEVATGDGATHEVETLLVAAGPWTGRLLAGIGVDLPLAAERHVVASLKQHPEEAESLVGVFLADFVGGYWSTPQGGSVYTVGPISGVGLEAVPTYVDPDAPLARISDEEFAWLADRAGRRVPGRARSSRSGGWSALLDVSPDHQPVIGRVAERVYVDAGTSGHGFKIAPVLGRYVAELLTGTPDPRIEQFSPDRFAAGLRVSAGIGAARVLG